MFYGVGVNEYNIDFKFNTIHAEVNAVRATSKQLKPTRVNMIVFRVNKKGEYVMSKPCNCCMRTISIELKKKNFKCNKIYYTTQEGEIQSQYINHYSYYKSKNIIRRNK